MHRTIPALVLGVVLFALPACDSTHDVNHGTQPRATTAAGPLEGTWKTNLTQPDQRAYLHSLGYGRAVADAVASASGQNIPGPHFAVEFQGTSFRMYYMSTGETWQAGTFTMRGNNLVLDDEAPVGHFLLAYRIDEDHAQFSHFGSDLKDMEFMPGVPDWIPGAAMWGSSTWTRE